MAVPVIANVNRIHGRFLLDIPEGEPWLLRNEFSYRIHRSLLSESCDTKALTRTKTTDASDEGVSPMSWRLTCKARSLLRVPSIS